MTGNTTFFGARHDICRPATPSTRLAGAMGLPEPVRRGKIGSNRSSSGECRLKLSPDILEKRTDVEDCRSWRVFRAFERHRPLS
jgi:hypothetical protein